MSDNDSQRDNNLQSNAVSAQCHYHEWNPMEGLSQSLLNSNDNDEGNTIQRLLIGVGKMELEYVLCPFNDGSGRCYKMHCRYKHVPYSSEVLNGLPKLQAALQSKKKPRCTASSLPNRVLPATGCISKVVVTTAFDPGNFYVVPENGWKCLCNTDEEVEGEAKFVPELNERQPQLTSYDTLAKLQIDMLDFHRASKFERTNEFVRDELVAVKLQTFDGRLALYRAKVLVDAVEYCDTEEDLFKPVDVALELIDYGLSCLKSSADIFPLPEDFVYVSPMAYKCQLYGISPIMGRWSTSSIKRFRDLVKGQHILAEVVRTIPILLGDNDSSCFVTIYIKSQDDNYIDPAKDLINAGFGLEWNVVICE